jgi:hypothetical protein
VLAAAAGAAAVGTGAAGAFAVAAASGLVGRHGVAAAAVEGSFWVDCIVPEECYYCCCC